MNQVTWTYQYFDELTVPVLYSLMKLRSEVFVLEQNCVYLDADGKDLLAHHLCGWFNGSLVAYARILPPGIAFREASIGRVCTATSYRKNGAGRQLMLRAIQHTFNQYDCASIRIGAQLYLHQFYASLGFHRTGEGYLEDGIPHVEMLLAK